MSLFIRWTTVLQLIAISLSFQAANAQISGTVTDSIGQPLHMVSVVLLQDTSFVAATTTNEHGHFSLTTTIAKGKKYTLHITMVNYLPLTKSFGFPEIHSLKKFTLSQDPRALAEVSVTARLPLITRRTDRYLINVENSVLANGLTGLDVLQRSPGIWVDNSGNIRLKGTQAVTVMINHVIQRMSAEELADYLRSLKSEDISRIEVIPTPPAEFEAEGSGGIVQIFLKKARKTGWSGTVNSQYWWQQQKPYLSTGITLNYQMRKLNLSATYGYVSDSRLITEHTSIYYPDLTAYQNATNRHEKISRQQYRLAGAYDINSKQSISVESTISRMKFDHTFESNETHVSDTNRLSAAYSQKSRVFGLEGMTLNYLIDLDTLGSALRFIFDYSSSDRSEQNNFVETQSLPAQNILWRPAAPTGTKIRTAQADYTKVVGRVTTYKAGVKYGSISRDNVLITEELVNNSWKIDSIRTNHFDYSESLLMAYSTIERTINETVIKAGVRAEQTFSKGHAIYEDKRFSRRYFGLFPSIFIIRPIDRKKENTLSLSYTRRLTRPAMSDLNPARLVFSKYTALIGDPNLLPEFSDNFSATYQLKKHSLDFYFSHTRNSISLSVKAGENNSLDYYSSNTGSASQYGINYSGSSSPFKNWTIANNLSAYRSAYQFDGVAYKQNSLSASSVHVFYLDKIGDIDFIAEYRSPYIYTNLYTYGNFNMDLGITKKLFRKKIRLRLSGTDLLNTVREKEVTNEKGTRLEFYRKRPTRTIRVSVTYNFSKGRKVDDRKTVHSNTEERSRGIN